MNTWRSLATSAVVVALSTSTTYAGPCLQEIIRVQAEINAKLGSKAAAGPSASESTAATMHHQPTPRSVGEAETKLGTISAEQVTAVVEAMTRAREADRTGDQSACEQALSDVRQILRQ